MQAGDVVRVRGQRMVLATEKMWGWIMTNGSFYEHSEIATWEDDGGAIPAFDRARYEQEDLVYLLEKRAQIRKELGRGNGKGVDRIADLLLRAAKEIKRLRQIAFPVPEVSSIDYTKTSAWQRVYREGGATDPLAFPVFPRYPEKSMLFDGGPTLRPSSIFSTGIAGPELQERANDVLDKYTPLPDEVVVDERRGFRWWCHRIFRAIRRWARDARSLWGFMP